MQEQHKHLCSSVNSQAIAICTTWASLGCCCCLAAAAAASLLPGASVSAPDAAGYLDLVIKAYAEGKMSKHMGDMKVTAE